MCMGRVGIIINSGALTSHFLPMSPSFKLRPYQQEAVNATLGHFRKSDEPAVMKRKESLHQVTFASVQSVSANMPSGMLTGC